METRSSKVRGWGIEYKMATMGEGRLGVMTTRGRSTTKDAIIDLLNRI